jgi:predicted HicB family RNase H-like nuclease
MNKDQVRAIALQHGFELKAQADGAMDLHPYVYKFAQALMSEPKRKANPGAPRTEVFAMRIDLKTKYLAELAARSQRRSLANFIEWAIEKALHDVQICPGVDCPSVADKSGLLWAADPARRLKILGDNYPDLLDYDEQLAYEATRE